MEQFFYRSCRLFLSMVVICMNFPASGQYLFTLKELIEMAETRDQQSFDKLMKAKKFAFHKRKTDEKGQVSFIYLDQNPTASELIGMVALMPFKGLASNGISLNTSANTFQFHMERQAEMEGFTLLQTKTNGDKEYVKVIGQKKWYFNIREPKREARATLQMVTLYAMQYRESDKPASSESESALNPEVTKDRQDAESRRRNELRQKGVDQRTVSCGERLGAKTAEELAILLLKCLKSNDKQTWMRCMHPGENETDDLSGKKFDRHREKLEAEGITNWAGIQFSRLTYPLRPMGGEKVDPDKTVPFSTIEITYRNTEFIGRIKIGTFVFCEGRWLVWFSGFPEDNQVVRNFGR